MGDLDKSLSSSPSEERPALKDDLSEKQRGDGQSGSISSDNAEEKPKGDAGDKNTAGSNPELSSGTTWNARIDVMNLGTINQFSEERYDPTRPHSDCPASRRFAFLAKEIETYSASLLRNRMLIVTSPQEEFRREAGLALVLNPRFEGYERRAPNRLGSQLDPRFEINTLIKIRDKGDYCIVMVDLDDGELGQIVPHKEEYIQYMLKALAEVNLWLVISTGEVNKIPARLRDQCWSPDLFTTIVTTLCNSDDARADQIIKKILAQRASWPKDTAEFIDEVEILAQQGLSALEAAIRDREIGEEIEPAATSLLSKEVLDLPPAEQQIYLSLLWLAAYFPHIGPADVDTLMSILLADVKVTRSSRPLGRPDRVAGNLIWSEENGEICRRLNIYFRRDDDQRRVIAFTRSSLRRMVRSHLAHRQSVFSERQFETLMRAGVMYLPGVSDAASNDAITLFISGMRESPDLRTWLLDDILTQLETDTERKPETILLMAEQVSWDQIRRYLGEEELQEDEAVQRKTFAQRPLPKALLVEGVVPGEPMRTILTRLARLLIRLDGEEKESQFLLWDFIRSLEKKGRFVSDLLLTVAAVPSFQPSRSFLDNLKVYATNLEPEMGRLRWRFYQILLRLMVKPGIDVIDLLEGIAGWLPRRHAPVSQPSVAADEPQAWSETNLALACLQDYPLASYFLPSSADYGAFPSRIPLLDSLMRGGEAESERRCALLVEWVFRPEWQDFPFSPLGFEPIPGPDWMADNFLFWLCLLLGSAGDGPDPRCQALAIRLLAAARARCDRTQRLWFRDRILFYRDDLTRFRADLGNKPRTRESQEESARVKIEINAISQIRALWKDPGHG